jgi:hypothetical protein
MKFWTALRDFFFKKFWIKAICAVLAVLVVVMLNI